MTGARVKRRRGGWAEATVTMAGPLVMVRVPSKLVRTCCSRGEAEIVTTAAGWGSGPRSPRRGAGLAERVSIGVGAAGTGIGRNAEAAAGEASRRANGRASLAAVSGASEVRGAEVRAAPPIKARLATAATARPRVVLSRQEGAADAGADMRDLKAGWGVYASSSASMTRA